MADLEVAVALFDAKGVEHGGIKDMDAPGLRLHVLKGDWAGFYAVNVSGNWRVIFCFEDGAVVDVDYLDYH